MDTVGGESSGITLVLPSLRALKAANAGKKTIQNQPKVPRPVKLKPLKEVLTKLITQIKKKDDYAFFIHPVDTAKIPGYTDVIKHPMDFGTMMAKVTKGRYRSLEEFTADFRLVTTNAKTFNPPGSIYYTEADRLETWGLDHISRASAHVIEYETDWNIDIEQDEDGSQQLVNIEDEVSTPRDMESMAAGSPAPSMTPAPGQASTSGQGRRGPRGPYKKHAQPALSEGLDAEGRMPGAKDGVGVFPPGSDWAELMVALKIKGKRYKTKKERLRFEKEGPPYQPDGSLDYAEMEDPFSIFNVLVPDPPTRPQVIPLYPPPAIIPPPSTTIDHQSPMHVPMPITLPPHRPSPVLATLSNIPTPAPPPVATSSTTLLHPPKKRRHWTILRNVSARSRAKEKDSDPTTDDTKVDWKTPRDAGPVDYGTFSTFIGDLVASAMGSNVGTTTAIEYIHGSESRLYATIRSTIEHRGVKRKREDPAETSDENTKEVTFWTDERAEEGWDYLRNVVYGGVDGYAYVRSLAEFVAPSIYFDAALDTEPEAPTANGDPKVTKGTPPENEIQHVTLPLGAPLARYVEDNLVDTVTRGRHGWLRDALSLGTTACLPSPTLCRDGTTSPFNARLAVLPGATRAMATYKTWTGEPLDMASLIRAPDELAKESVLEGGPVEGGERVEIERAMAWSVGMIEALSARVGSGEMKVKEEMDDPRVKMEEEEEEETDTMDVDPKPEPNTLTGDALESKKGPNSDEEDSMMKRLRLNLLALAKRAPLDKIAKLPVELVPEDIRGIVPIAQ